MLQIAIKVLITSVLVVAISEASKRSVLLGAILASVPLTSILAMSWLYAETRDAERVANLTTGIFWLVLPSLVLFLVFPVLLRKGVPFAMSLAVAIGLTAASYAAMLAILKRFGLEI